MTEVRCTVAVVSYDEPVERLRALFEAIERQTLAGALEVVVAAPLADEPTVRRAATDAGCSVVFVENPDGRRTPGLNRILQVATAPVVARLDARSRPPQEYLERCCARLDADPDVGVVGGAQIVDTDAAHGSRAVARALANPYALGSPSYRRADASGAVDTVYLGAFRRQELVSLGGFDERLDANEDFDLAARYRATGKLVWLEADLNVGYLPRGTVVEVLRQYARFGAAKARYWGLGAGRPNIRQATALVGGAGFVVGMAVAPGHRRSLVAALAAGALLADHLAEPTEPDLALRIRAAGVSVGIVASWWGGVVGGVLRSAYRRTGDPAGDASGS